MMLARRRVDPAFDSAMIYSREEKRIHVLQARYGVVQASRHWYTWQKAEYENCGE